MRRLLLAVLALAAFAPSAHAAPALVKIGDFDAPVHIAAPPGDGRLFVVEQDGLVKVLGGGQTKVYLDIRALTATGGSEQGLLSIAFPPDHAASGLSYVFLTAPDRSLRVYEHRASTDPDAADPASRRLVISIPHAEATNHNGGQLAFGPDGLLYIGTGDGGNSNDVPVADAENTGSLLGKVLRIDPRGATPGAHTVPADNPFGNAVWAYGLRNPWRFSFDRATGDLIIADVGQGHREEIDFAPAATGRSRGLDFGWRCYEGKILTTASASTDDENAAPLCSEAQRPANPTAPVIDFRHADGFASITGGFVVRDPGLPSLAGRYLYGDIGQSTLRSVVLGAGTATGDRAEPALPAEIPTSFGEDACGRVYVSMIPGYAHAPGSVYRIEDGAATPCSFAAGPGAGGGGGSGGGPSQPADDTRRPGVRVSVSGRRSLAARRRLRVAVRTDELASVRITGRLRGVARFRTARRRLRANRRTVLTVRVTRPAARKLRRTLRRKRVIAALTILARDAAGNQRRVTRRVVVPR